MTWLHLFSLGSHRQCDTGRLTQYLVFLMCTWQCIVLVNFAFLMLLASLKRKKGLSNKYRCRVEALLIWLGQQCIFTLEGSIFLSWELFWIKICMNPISNNQKCTYNYLNDLSQQIKTLPSHFGLGDLQNYFERLFKSWSHPFHSSIFVLSAKPISAICGFTTLFVMINSWEE